MTHGHCVLVVEDNADDLLFIERALRKAAVKCPVAVMKDGDSALEYLEARGRFAGRPTPTLVLLDIKLPRRSGLEVLEAVRGHRDRPRMVIVVLTGSRQPDDIERAYAAGANSYLVKPISPAAMSDLVHQLSLYWLTSNEPAPRSA